MKLIAMSVRDEKIEAFLPPFFVRTKGEGIRSFTEAASDEKHQFCRHPDDYVLYCVGVFDDNSGRFERAEPDRILSVRECKVVAG